MAEAQRQMLSPPPAPAIEGLLRHEPSPNEGGDGRELATPQGLTDVVAHAEATKAQAEAQVKWITEHNTTLDGQGYKMARYHQERAVEETPVRAFLRQAMAEARLAPDPEQLEEGLTAAIATWRTARADKGLVLPGEKGWEAARPCSTPSTAP